MLAMLQNFLSSRKSNANLAEDLAMAIRMRRRINQMTPLLEELKVRGALPNAFKHSIGLLSIAYMEPHEEAYAAHQGPAYDAMLLLLKYGAQPEVIADRRVIIYNRVFRNNDCLSLRLLLLFDSDPQKNCLPWAIFTSIFKERTITRISPLRPLIQAIADEYCKARALIASILPDTIPELLDAMSTRDDACAKLYHAALAHAHNYIIYARSQNAALDEISSAASAAGTLNPTAKVIPEYLAEVALGHAATACDALAGIHQHYKSLDMYPDIIDARQLHAKVITLFNLLAPILGRDKIDQSFDRGAEASSLLSALGSDGTSDDEKTPLFLSSAHEGADRAPRGAAIALDTMRLPLISLPAQPETTAALAFRAATEPPDSASKLSSTTAGSGASDHSITSKKEA